MKLLTLTSLICFILFRVAIAKEPLAIDPGIDAQAGRYAKLTAYLELVEHGMRTSGQSEAAKSFRAIKDDIMFTALALAGEKRDSNVAVRVTNARIELAKKQMLKEIDNDYGNIAILIDRYSDDLERALRDPPRVVVDFLERKANEPARTTETEKADTRRKTFTSPEGDFSVSAPGQLTDKSRTVHHPIGRVRRNYYSVVAEDTSFSVERSDFEADVQSSRTVEELLDGGRDSLVSSLKGKFVKERPVSLNGILGREITVALHQGTITFIARAYVKGNHFYSVTVATVPAKIDSLSIRRFFDSFEIHR